VTVRVRATVRVRLTFGRYHARYSFDLHDWVEGSRLAVSGYSPSYQEKPKMNELDIGGKNVPQGKKNRFTV
jgi:hypothetical protein